MWMNVVYEHVSWITISPKKNNGSSKPGMKKHMYQPTVKKRVLHCWIDDFNHQHGPASHHDETQQETPKKCSLDKGSG
jgi:hypothetical protein